MSIYFTKNLWGYEQIFGPPSNTPSNLLKIYLTDDISKKNDLLSLGWDYVIINTDYKDVSDLQKRRRIISEINCFPQKFIKNLNKNKLIFVNDSNIIKLWDGYIDFVNKVPNDKCLFMIYGWFNGERDNIISECNGSLLHSNWSYDHKNIENSTKKYIKEIESKGLDVKKIPVYSAKYFGWNIEHPMYETISKKFYEEYNKHLQGNIILSYLSVLFSEHIFTYKYNNDNTGQLSAHNFKS